MILDTFFQKSLLHCHQKSHQSRVRKAVALIKSPIPCLLENLTTRRMSSNRWFLLQLASRMFLRVLIRLLLWLQSVVVFSEEQIRPAQGAAKTYTLRK
jgi:hypothetical protein